ncbi:MAG TPA: septum formation family protein [Amycolatopsis sp.]|uniref:septum formation family protein n=1 Tax=Amycolatopsis sp. TaxID=37632 RepID=UPI002B47EF74|nr:septum formation family protein [Amycolatopsis sp.]HKS48127.1 septum formation family protein [Amycolatopsis sp.]
MLVDKVEGNTLRTRLVMVGAFAGAILALSLTVAFSWGDGVLGGGRVEESSEAKTAFRSAEGNCVFWAQPDVSDIHLVPCDQPHLYEVTGVVNIGDKYAPGAPFPSVEEWRNIALERCTNDTDKYLGKQLDPYGRFTVSALRPGNSEWATGDREMRCVLQWAAPGGALQPIKGKVADQNQSAVWDTGTCLALAGKTVGNPIDCAQPHAYEIVATVDLTKQFKGGYPNQKDQSTWLDTECNNDVQAYAGGIDLGAQKLILTWDTREQESWDAGSTLVNCMVGAKLPDDSGLQAITGSIKQAAQDAPPQGGQPPAEGGQPTTQPGG